MAYSGGAGFGGGGKVNVPKPGRPAVGSRAGAHGAIVAPYGGKPPARAGFTTIGTGHGGWIYKPNAPKAPAAKPGGGKPPGGHGGGGGMRFAGPGVPLNSPALDPSQPLSGQSLYNSAAALANAQTQGPLAELASQIAQNNRQTTGAINLTGGYLQNLGNQARQSVTDEGNIGQQLNAQLGYVGGSEQQALQGIGTDAQNSLAKYTPGGTEQSAMQSLTAELARQQGLAAQQQGAFKSAGATQGANYSGLAASNLGTDALAGTQTLKGIAQSGEVKNEPLNAKIADLRAQKGALIGTDIGKLRQQEIANRYTAQGLGLKQQDLKVTAANDQARNALTQRAQNISAQNDLINQQIKWADLHQRTSNDAASQAAKQAALNLGWYRATHSGGAAPTGGKPRALTPNETNAWFSKLGKVEALVDDGHHHGQTNQQIRQFLQSGQNPSRAAYDPVMVETAFQLLGYGSINRSQAALLHNMGLRGGSFRGAPIKVTANFNPNNPNPLSSAFTG